MAWVFTKDIRYAKCARKILTQYADRYPDLPFKGYKGRPYRGGKVHTTVLAESGWLIMVANAYDLIAGSPALSDADREAITQDLPMPAARVCRLHGMGIENISCFRNAAIGCAALAAGDAELAHYAVHSKSGIVKQIAEGIQDDGTWLENSWGYHLFALPPLCRLAEACTNTGVLKVWQVNNARLRGTFDAPILFAMPDGRLPAFNQGGKSESIFATHVRSNYEYAIRRYRDPRYATVLRAQERKRWPALLYGEELSDELPTFAESRDFRASGVAVMRSGEDRDQKTTWRWTTALTAVVWGITTSLDLSPTVSARSWSWTPAAYPAPRP